jgi:hypothetical protein
VCVQDSVLSRFQRASLVNRHNHPPSAPPHALQDADGQVRDASGDALAAYAAALAAAEGSVLPGGVGSPIVRVIFDCLAEQKREGQMGASHALLKVGEGG